LKNGLGETLDPSITVRQKTVNAMWEGACLKVLLIDGVRKTVGPIGKQDRRCVTFGLKEVGEVIVTRGDLLKGSTT